LLNEGKEEDYFQEGRTMISQQKIFEIFFDKRKKLFETKRLTLEK